MEWLNLSISARPLDDLLPGVPVTIFGEYNQPYLSGSATMSVMRMLSLKLND